MIRLAEPLFLLLLLIVPALLFLQNRRRNTILFSRVILLETLPQSWAQRMQPLLPILYTLALIMLIVALARPQRGLDESKVRTEAVDMILLLDLSESMDTQDFTRANQRISRLDATKDVLNRFLENRPNDRIGIVGFASLPYAVAPLTLDHSWLIERMKSLHTRMLDGRRTAIGDGIASAINRLRESEAKSKVIILLTDGANNAGTLSPENAATAAAALDIKIYTIGAAGVRTGFFANRNEVDEETLMQLAQTTDGRFYRARNLANLEAIYDEIDQLEKTEIEVERYTRYQELAGNWMVAGLLLLTIEQLLSTSRLGRLP
jgi:Ca-activated chloride channel family protein